jgi:hypothetical protein
MFRRQEANTNNHTTHLQNVLYPEMPLVHFVLEYKEAYRNHKY